MPSKSKSQQRLFGWVHACQKGTAKNCPSNVSKVAGSISSKDAEDLAKTKHKGLPEKVKKKKKKGRLKDFKEWQLEEQMNTQQRGIANQLQGDGGTSDLGRKVGMSTYVRVLGNMLNKIEKKLGANAHQQPGEQTHNWHQDAVKVMYEAMKMAVAGGRTTWSQSSQLANIKKNMNNAQTAQPVTPSPAQQQQGTNGTGPTPLGSV